MIPVKITPNPITIEKGRESVVDWFELNKQAFYTLGWFILGNQHHLEELFYLTITKAQKEWPRMKQETPFDLWVTSIFMQHCRELSHKTLEENGSRPELLQDFDRLKDDEREAMVLRYVKGFSQVETAHILHSPVEQLQALLLSGIRSLRGDKKTFNGCNEYQQEYINYLERTMDRPKRIDFEIHIYHCEKCQEDLASFQDVRLSLVNYLETMEGLHVPSSFMEKVKERLLEDENRKRQKNEKQRKVWLAIAGVFTLLMGIGVFTGFFSNTYYSWTEDDEQLRALLKKDFAERVNLAEKSDGVKITIKSVVADDFQTLVFYEIEDTKENHQYVINYDDGVIVTNVNKIMSQESYPRYYPPDLDSAVNKSEKNVYQGKVSLPALKIEDGTIELQISKLMKLDRDSTAAEQFWGYGRNQVKTGEWNFEIPVTKQSSKEYVLKGQKEVEGVPVRFEKLLVAPTATSLQYSIYTAKPEKRLEFLQFKNLEVNDQLVKADLYGSSPLPTQQDVDWYTSRASFDTLFGEEPETVNVQLASAYLTVQDNKTIELDATKEYPQTFEYSGSTISIDKVEVGTPTTVVISDRKVENREYEGLHMNVVGDIETETTSMGMETEGIIVDKNGVQYDINTTPINYEEIEQPRHFITVQTFQLEGSNIIPKKIEIYGYNTTKYLNDRVKLSLK